MDISLGAPAVRIGLRGSKLPHLPHLFVQTGLDAWGLPPPPGSLDIRYQSDSLIVMETTLTDFQRNFSAARAAADRGETVRVKTAGTVYFFARQSEQAARPLADLEHLFGVVQRPRCSETAHETIRLRLKTHRAG
jgi:hypothetical protein